MQRRAVLRRAFPYLVIGIGGFALAYLVIYIFVLPSRIIPPEPSASLPSAPPLAAPLASAATAGDTAAALANGQSLLADTAPVPAVAPPPAPEPVPISPADRPPPLQVPDLVGMALPDARGILNGLGLQTFVDRDTSSFQPPNTVLRQRPAAGQNIPPRGTVTLTASYFPPDTGPRSAAPDSGNTHAGTARPADTLGSFGRDSAARRRRPLPPIVPTVPDTTRGTPH